MTVFFDNDCNLLLLLLLREASINIIEQGNAKIIQGKIQLPEVINSPQFY